MVSKSKKYNSSDCTFCIEKPARLPQEVFENLAFLPETLLDHYRVFTELHRTETNERDRLKHGLEASENDKQNKELLNSQQIRDVITCANCLKPRIYSSSKLKHMQIIAVRRVKDEGTYQCGESLFPQR